VQPSQALTPELTSLHPFLYPALARKFYTNDIGKFKAPYRAMQNVTRGEAVETRRM